MRPDCNPTLGAHGCSGLNTFLPKEQPRAGQAHARRASTRDRGLLGAETAHHHESRATRRLAFLGAIDVRKPTGSLVAAQRSRRSVVRPRRCVRRVRTLEPLRGYTAKPGKLKATQLP